MCKMSIKDEINYPMVSYPFVCIIIPVVPPYGYLIFQYRRVCKYQRGNQNRISKKNRQHNDQMKKVQKEKQRSTKYTSTSNQRSSKTNLKTGDELVQPISIFYIKDSATDDQSVYHD